MSNKEDTPESVPPSGSEEEYSDEELPREVEEPLSDQFSKIGGEITGDNGFYFLVHGKAYTKHTKVTEITKEYMLGLPHLLLDFKLIEPAFEFCNKILQYQWDCDYGDTQCNNDIWYNFMLPESAKTLRLLTKKQWSKGFTGLLGMYVFMNRNGGHWIHDQEVYTDENIFKSFFKKYNRAWRLLLKQSDDVIGLNYPGGLPGGYRENLTDMLRRQQDDTNENVLKDMFSDIAGAKLNMVNKKKPTDVNLENQAFLSVNKENEGGEASKRGAKRGVAEEQDLSPNKVLKTKDGKRMRV